MHVKVMAHFILCLLLIYGGVNNESILASDEKYGETTSEGQGLKEESALNKWAILSGNLALVSDYLFRGQTQTFGEPAVQGGFMLSQKLDEGFYAGVWGSNVDSITTAPNGAGLELDLYGGYAYKYNSDLSFRLELRNTRYPGARASLPLTDKFDYLEIIPGVTYKIFSAYFAYSISDRSGVNQNFAPTFPVPLKPNGNSRGSWYAEASANMPISFITDHLKFRLLCGRWHAQHYTVLDYTVFSVGLKYKIPKKWGGVSIFVNTSTTTGNKKYFRVVNSAGKVKTTVGPTIWFGISKKF